MDDKTHALYFIWEKNHGVSNKMTTMTSSGMEAIAYIWRNVEKKKKMPMRDKTHEVVER